MSAHDQPLRGILHLSMTNSDIDWNGIYRQELPRIYNYFRYRLGDDALAQDLTSATFEKAWLKRDSYRRDLAAFSTWLLTIARNTATDHLRTHRFTLSLDTLRDQPASDSPHTVLAQQQEIQQLGILLTHLNEHERELVALKYGAERNNREIAAQLGMSESNVGTTLHRIVSKLRQEWESEKE